MGCGYFIVLAMVLAFQVPSYARVIGTEGATYPIIEQDALTEVEEAAKRVDWEKVFKDGAKDTKAFRTQVDKLPRVTQHSVRTFGMIYTLEEDMANPSDPSKPLYPKGFTFNPLEYSMLPRLIFIDGGDPAQVAWVKSLKDDTAMVILTSGEYKAVGSALKSVTYNADDRLIQMFKLKAVPSIVTQKGAEIQVEEISIARSTSRH